MGVGNTWCGLHWRGSGPRRASLIRNLTRGVIKLYPNTGEPSTHWCLPSPGPGISVQIAPMLLTNRRHFHNDPSAVQQRECKGERGKSVRSTALLFRKPHQPEPLASPAAEGEHVASPFGINDVHQQGGLAVMHPCAVSPICTLCVRARQSASSVWSDRLMSPAMSLSLYSHPTTRTTKRISLPC